MQLLLDAGKFANITKYKKGGKKTTTYEQHCRVDLFGSLMVRQIRIDMKMMGQTKKKEGRREERKGVLRSVNSSKISVIASDRSYCLITSTKG